MRCEDARERLSAFVDGELPADEAEKMRAHLAACASCRAEEAELRRLSGAIARHLAPPAVNEEEWGEMARTVLSRGARGIGWTLLVPAALVLAGGGLGMFFVDPEVPAWVRIGVGALIGGLVALFFSVLADRLAARRHERYEEVER